MRRVLSALILASLASACGASSPTAPHAPMITGVPTGMSLHVTPSIPLEGGMVSITVFVTVSPHATADGIPVDLVIHPDGQPEIRSRVLTRDGGRVYQELHLGHGANVTAIVGAFTQTVRVHRRETPKLPTLPFTLVMDADRFVVTVGQSVRFVATAAPAVNLRYHWDFNGDDEIDLITTGNTATATYQDPGDMTSRVYLVVDETGHRAFTSNDLPIIVKR